MRRLRLLYEFLSAGEPSHIDNLLPQMRSSHRHPNTFHVFLVELNISKKLFFPGVVNEWNELDPNVLSSSNSNIFRNALLKFIKPVERKIYNIDDPFGIKC